MRSDRSGRRRAGTMPGNATPVRLRRAARWLIAAGALLAASGAGLAQPGGEVTPPAAPALNRPLPAPAAPAANQPLPAPAAAAGESAPPSSAEAVPSGPPAAAVRPPVSTVTARDVAATLNQSSFNVGVLSDAPPFSYVTNLGYRTGFDFDIARSLCSRLAIQCTFVPLPQADIVPALEERRIDFAVASLPITPELEALVDFTEPYYHAVPQFVVPRDDPLGFTQTSDPKRSVAAVARTPYATYLAQQFGDAADIRLYSDDEEMWIDLAMGRLDAVLAPAATAQQRFLSDPLGRGFQFAEVPVTGPAIFGRGTGVAVREEDLVLLDALNLALAELQRSSVYAELRSRYLEAPPAAKP